jgi:hypothetical protein
MTAAMSATLVAVLALAPLTACGAASGPAVPRSTYDGGGPIYRRPLDAGTGSSTDAASRGSIAGQITLFGAASSAGVKVTLQPLGLVTLSIDPSGDFLFDAIPPGPFTLTFSATGYATSSFSDVLAPGDAAFESLQLQRSVALGILDAGAILWIGGPAASRLSDAGTPAMYATSAEDLYVLDPAGLEATPIYSTDAGISAVGVTNGGSGFFIIGSPSAPAIAIAAQSALTLVDAAGIIPETLNIAGERLFFARKPDGGRLHSWASVGAGDLWFVPELDAMLPSPPPVVFGQNLAGYRQQSPACAQLMLFGAGAFETLADCLPFEPGVLDVSLDGELISAVRSPSGNASVSFVDILGCDGGRTALDGSFAPAYSHAVPLDSETLYLVDPWGGISLFAAPSALLYASSTLGQTLRPGGSFLAAVVADAGTSSVLVTGNGAITLPFAAPWSTPSFSPNGRYAIFFGLPTLFDLVGANEYPLVVDPAMATFSAGNDVALLLGTDGTLAVIDLGNLPSTGAGGDAQPVGAFLEGTAITAAAFIPGGNTVIYAGIDPTGRNGLFSQPSR